MRLEHTYIKSISIESCAGSHVNDCIKEAVILAVNNWENVVLTHSDNIYRVDVNDLFAAAKELDHD